MLLVFTAVLLLISMPAHEAIKILHKEQNIMNKNHLGLLHRAYVPQSTMAFDVQQHQLQLYMHVIIYEK